MKAIIILFLIMLTLLSCKRDRSQFGTCEIQYNNISLQPSSSVSVRVTDHNSVSFEYMLTQDNNTIILPLETGDRYFLKIGEIRLDSIYDVRFLWSDNSVIYYSFMFNNTTHDKASNRIIIDL